MARTLQELHDDPDVLKTDPDGRALCGECREPLTDKSGARPSDKGTVCDDCYYEKMGEEIERHPIFAPTRRR